MSAETIFPEVLDSSVFKLTLAWRHAKGQDEAGQPVSHEDFLQKRGIELAELNGQVSEALLLADLFQAVEAWHRSHNSRDVFSYLRAKGVGWKDENIVKAMIVRAMGLK